MYMLYRDRLRLDLKNNFLAQELLIKIQTKLGDIMVKAKKKIVRIHNYEKDNALSVYLREINRIPLLTRDEETRIAREAAQGSPKAKEQLVAANLRFVVNVAKKYQNQGLSLDDLISEGNIGLINAIERFDVEKGYHFISYAVWWIRQAILKSICEKSRTIRLPLNRANELVQIEKMRRELYSIKGEEPQPEELASALGLDAQLIKELLSISREHVSLETPVYTDKDSASLGDFLQDFANESPDQLLIKKSLRQDINEALDSLTPKESQIIEYRFGLNDKKPLSLKEIGLKFKLTKERIRQIEKKAIQRLQHPARSGSLANYMVG